MSIGIENRGHRKRLMFFIDSLPPEEMFQHVPVCLVLLSQTRIIEFSIKSSLLCHMINLCKNLFCTLLLSANK